MPPDLSIAASVANEGYKRKYMDFLDKRPLQAATKIVISYMKNQKGGFCRILRGTLGASLIK